MWWNSSWVISNAKRWLCESATLNMPLIWKIQQQAQDWKRSVFIPIQRKAMPKNAQTTAQLHSSHMLVRLCWWSFKLGFTSMWIENFQLYNLSLEKAKEPEIRLLAFTGSWRKQGSSRKISTSASLTTLKPLTGSLQAEAFDCGSQLWKTQKRWEYQTNLTYLLRNLYVGQEATARIGHVTTN